MILDEIEIDPSDLRVDTYRASGAGGQHRQQDEVRRAYAHPHGAGDAVPERALAAPEQGHRDEDDARQAVPARAAEARIRAERGEGRRAEHRLRIADPPPYVMQPYQMVKDLRTRHETGAVQAVLDGDLDPFIRSFLLHKARVEQPRRCRG